MSVESKRTIYVYEYLFKYTDQEHPLTMPRILAMLTNDGMKCDRRSVYASISELQGANIPIHYRRKLPNGYYMNHEFTPAEITILRDAVDQSVSLSRKESQQLHKKLCALLSENEQKQLQKTTSSRKYFDENHTLCNISIILEAIHNQHPISFKYFDYDTKKHKKFRKHGRRYIGDPYAVVSDKNRYYCIIYNKKYDNHNIYRIDKMDRIEINEKEEINPVPFSLDDFIENTFGMYHGDKAISIGLRCKNKLLSQIYDEFLDNVIISDSDEEMFTCYIKAPITPTLCGWIIQYQDELEVIQPQELKDALVRIASDLIQRYNP